MYGGVSTSVFFTFFALLTAFVYRLWANMTLYIKLVGFDDSQESKELL